MVLFECLSYFPSLQDALLTQNKATFYGKLYYTTFPYIPPPDIHTLVLSGEMYAVAIKSVTFDFFFQEVNKNSTIFC